MMQNVTCIKMNLSDINDNNPYSLLIFKRITVITSRQGCYLQQGRMAMFV